MTKFGDHSGNFCKKHNFMGPLKNRVFYLQYIDFGISVLSKLQMTL